MEFSDGRKAAISQLTVRGITVTINSQTMLVEFRDNSGNVTKCSGAAAPTDGGSGYAIGCEFRLTTGNGVGTTVYVNEGSASSCDFNASPFTEVGDISAVTAGDGLSGGGTTGALTLAVGAGRGTTVRSDNVDVAVNVYNDTGGTLTIGTLVNLSSFNTTLGVRMTKADADAGIRATHVVLDAITNNTAGVVYPVGTALTVNTGGRTIGDLVYVDSTTAGGFTFTAPTGADQMVQIVGIVKVVDAATGEIVFFPGSAHVTKLATSMIQDQAVNANKLDSGMFLSGGGILKNGSNLQEGITIYNNTGGTLNPGELVNLSGFTGTDGIVVTKADADAGIEATHVVFSSINNLSSGAVVPLGAISNLNTGGRTIGDLVYVDATTAGAFTFTAPTGADQMVQVIGIVKTVDAGTGQIQFFPGLSRMTKIPTSHLQDLAVSTAKLANDAVTEAKVADSNGLGDLYVAKEAIVVYDFAVGGGTAGVIALAGSPTIPDNAVVWVDSYEVMTTLTSAGDTATLTLGLPTDGDLFTAIAINDGSNPWDIGFAVQGLKALAAASQTPKKTTAARLLQATVGVENVTAGKVVFHLRYWVAQ